MTPAAELDQAFRDQWGRLLALLVAQFRRLDLAEEGLADAFATAVGRSANMYPLALRSTISRARRSGTSTSCSVTGVRIFSPFTTRV